MTADHSGSDAGTQLFAALADLVLDWLPGQAWFQQQAGTLESVALASVDVLADGWPTIMHCTIDAQCSDGMRIVHGVFAVHQTYPDVHPAAVLGEVPTPTGPVFVVDALSDPVGALRLGSVIAPQLSLGGPSPRLGGPRSSAVVFDQQWQLTWYRFADSTPNPDIDIPRLLAAQGAAPVRPAVVTWIRDGVPLATMSNVDGRLADGVEVVRQSLGELLDRRCRPREQEHDIRPAAEALGIAVARLHVGLAAAFGSDRASGATVANWLIERSRRFDGGQLDLARLERAYRRLEHSDGLGQVIRVHGSLGLAELERNRRGWVVAGFEGAGSSVNDPLGFTSPLRDVASVLAGLRLAVAHELSVRRVGAASGLDLADRELDVLAGAWEERATSGFITGYTSIDDVHPLLPSDRLSRDALLAVFELSCEAEAVGQYRTYRPQMSILAVAAVEQLLGSDVTHQW